jgi:outer membrane protein OmpA-like peptidoglycan-associated protein
MTLVKVMATAVAAGALASAFGCGPRRVATAPTRPELVVLLGEPDHESAGRAVVSNASGSVELVADRDSTLIVKNQQPGATTPLSESDVHARFGDALSAQPPPPRVFTLYFLFESNELTDESRSSVPTILMAVRDRPVPDVVVVGHTDTIGTSDSNFKLGNRRATMVRDLLVGAGLDAALVKVMSLGEEDLLVPTADEVSEPRNRRVEIAVR